MLKTSVGALALAAFAAAPAYAADCLDNPVPAPTSPFGTTDIFDFAATSCFHVSGNQSESAVISALDVIDGLTGATWTRIDPAISNTKGADSGTLSFSSGQIGINPFGIAVQDSKDTTGFYVYFFDAPIPSNLTYGTGTYSNAKLYAADIPPIPEPGTYALLLAGLGVVGFVARRRRPI